MNKLTLTIGDKNLSSWSFRPWFLMKQAGIPFEEQIVLLDRPETRKVLREISPAGLVPFLTHETDAGAVKVWDTLAIAEYLNEQFPEKQLWPEASAARAIARSVAAEMHSGFEALRTVWPMHFTRIGLRHVTSGGVKQDLQRIDKIWSDCRAAYGAGGEFLFGAFSIADAFYAPVVSRIVTYGPVELSAAAKAYIDMMSNQPAYKDWAAGAAAEEAAGE